MRLPSTSLDTSLSCSFLRTTPAKNPRTECCAQPVAFIIAAIVAPVGDWSMATTQACFEPAPNDLDVLTAVALDGFEAFARLCADFGRRFFADFGIENSVRLSGVAPHRRSPTTATCRRGRDLDAPISARRLSAVPLQWRSDASAFWVILLLSTGRVSHWLSTSRQESRFIG